MRQTFVDLFYAVFISYLLFHLIEIVFPGLISTYFSFRLILIPVFICGVISSFIPHKIDMQNYEYPLRRFDVWLAMGIGVVGLCMFFLLTGLETRINVVISCLSGVILTAIYIIELLPENFELLRSKLNFRWYHFGMLPLFSAVVVFLILRNITSPLIITSAKLSPDKYQIVVINRSTNFAYSQTYKNMLMMNGYTNVITDSADSYPETFSTVTILYGVNDVQTSEEVAGVVSKIFSDVETKAIYNPAPHTIVVIIR